MKEDITYQSATRLLKQIKNKKISCSGLLEAFIEKIESRNPVINAVVARDYEGARMRAGEADKALNRGENWGPLHGLPITVKDTFKVAGMPCAAGAERFRDYRPLDNADVVQALIDAGAVIMGKTNVPFMAMDFQSYNAVYGQTNNPWDPSRTPGGSSGGSAAALAAGMTGLDIGSDIGGSIRIPAHFCGVYGHKSSFDIVAKQGHIPPPPEAYPEDYTVSGDISVAGPMARSAGDLDLAMGLLTGPGRSLCSAWRIELPRPVKKTLEDYRIGIWLDDPFCPIDAAVGDVLQNHVDALARTGAAITELKPDIDFARSHDVYVGLYAASGSLDMPDDLFDRLKKEAEGNGERADGPRSRFVRGTTLSHRQWLQLDLERQILRKKWADFFGNVDVLICPAAPVAAFPHDHGKLYDRTLPVNGKMRSYFDTLYTWSGLTGVAYLPSTALPVGCTAEGLPVGAQIVGPYLADRTTISAAALIEEALGGFVPPPNLSDV